MTLSSKVELFRYVNYFNIFDIPGLANVRINTKIMADWLYDIYNQRYENHTQMYLTFIFKINHHDQVTDFGLYEIPDIVNVRIHTRSRLQHVNSRSNTKGHTMNGCQSHIFFPTFLISSTSKMLESTPRSSLYHVCNRG